MAEHRKMKRAEFDKEMIKAEKAHFKAQKTDARSLSQIQAAECLCGRGVRNAIYDRPMRRTSDFSSGRY